MRFLFASIEPKFTQNISKKWLKLLRALNIWVSISILSWGVSFTALCISFGKSYIISILFGGVLVIFFLVFDAYTQLSINLSNIRHEQKQARAWRRLLIAGFMCAGSLVFTQPYVLLLLNNNNNYMSGFHITENELLAGRNILDINNLKVELSEVVRMIGKENNLNSDLSLSGEAFNNISLASVAHKKALLIGNNEYTNATILQGAVNDVVNLSQSLKRLGFDVRTVTNGSRQAIEFAFRRYLDELQPGDISFFFYSGHGFQYKGNNYIVPVDFSPEIDDKTIQSVSLNRITEAISQKKVVASIIAIDACRKDISAGNGEGLAPIQAGDNTYIALAAAPGKVSYETDIYSQKRKKIGRQGIFTNSLLEHIEEHNDIDKIFREANVDVGNAIKKITGNERDQEIWISHNLKGELILSKNDLVQNTTAMLNDSNPCLMYANNNSNVSSGLFSICLRARAIEISQDIQSKEAQTKRLISSKELDSHTDSLAERNINLYEDIWRNPVKPFFTSAILFLIIASSFVLRAVMTNTQNKYAENIYIDSLDLIEQRSTKFLRTAREFPYAPDEEYLSRNFSSIYMCYSYVNAINNGSVDGLMDFLNNSNYEEQDR